MDRRALILLAACTSDPDPLDALRDAGIAYDRGRSALDAEDPGEAADAFAEARRLHPQDRTLPLWQAKAHAEGADLPAALAVLDGLLTAHPGVSAGWYNRAAYRMRGGDRDGALADLRIALRTGIRTPFEAALDPDFAALVGSPAAEGVLPAAPVLLAARGPAGPVFLGGNLEVRLLLTGVDAPLPEVRVENPEAGCLRLVRLVEDDVREGAVLTRQVLLAFQADAPCRVDLGPFTAVTGGFPSTTAPVPVQVDAPPGVHAERRERLPASLPLPASAAPGATPFRAVRVPAGVVALGPPNSSPLGGGRSPDVVLEWRVEGQPRARGGFWAEAGPLVVEAGEWRETVSAEVRQDATSRGP